MTVVNQYGVQFDFATAVNLMDDAVREELHRELAPCSEQVFFDAYCSSCPDWELAKANPVF